MTGRHRGGRSLRWRLVVAVMAAAVGRGHVGRHRLIAAALGRPVEETVVRAAAQPSPAALAPAALTSAVLGSAVATSAVATSAVATTAVATSAAPAAATGPVTAPRLRIVPVPAPPDPLVDTLPHPVVTLFPIFDAKPAQTLTPHSAASADDQVFAQVDGERDERATAELAGASPESESYRGKHSA